jgi:hypothetical protein
MFHGPQNILAGQKKCLLRFEIFKSAKLPQHRRKKKNCLPLRNWGNVTVGNCMWGGGIPNALAFSAS